MVCFVVVAVERAGSFGTGHRCAVEEPTVVVGAAIGPSRLFCSGRPGNTMEETRRRQQRADCLRGAHEGLC